MAVYYIDGASGRDNNSGTSEGQAWQTLEVSSRLHPGDTLVGLPGTLRGTFRPPSGTSAAPITFRALEPGTVTIDGSVRIDTMPWQKVTNGWQTILRQQVFNVFQRDFQSSGKLANFNNRDFNQYNSNPQLDLHGTPAEFKYVNGLLRLNAIPSTPNAEPLFAALTELAINLNDLSHVVVDGITTRGHKTAVGTRNGTGIALNNCRFIFCGYTAVWLVGLEAAAMTRCTIQGAGSWGGHYEDCVHVERCGVLSIADCNLSYGGHSGLIMLDGVPGKITLRRLHFHQMGGSLLTLKRGIDNVTAEDCWFADAAKSTAVDAHKVPHAGIQLSGKNHVFRNCVFVDNGKDVLASSDGNADSNPVCSDNLFDRCTFDRSEAMAIEGQEYAPAGRLERNTWRDCIIKGEVALFYAGVGDHGSNRLQHCQVVGGARGVVLQDCSNSPLPNTGSTLTAPPDGSQPPPPNNGGTVTPGTPVLSALSPTSGPVGTLVTITGKEFGANPAVVVPVTVKPATPSGMLRFENLGGTDTSVSYTVPADAVTGDVFVRNMNTQKSSTNKLRFEVTGTAPANKPPVARPGGPYTGIVGQPVQFDGSASSDPDGTIALYEWKIGNTVVMQGPRPTFTWSAPGTVTLTLTVTDDKGATNTATTTATITEAPQPAELVVVVGASVNDLGASFSGGVRAGGPLPAGSTILVTVHTPDDRTGTATATIPGAQPPPLLHLDSLTPRDCHPGDTIAALGSGFVPGMFANLATMTGARLRIPVATVYDDKHLAFIVPANAGPSNVMLEDPSATPPRFSNTAALNVQPVTPPPPTGGNRIEDTFQFNGTAADQQLLRSCLEKFAFPWDALKQGLGISKIQVEFADLSQYGVRLVTADNKRLQRFKVSPTEHRRILRSSLATVPLVRALDAEDDEHEEDHSHVLWSDQVAGLPDEARHYVAGLAWHGKLQVEQRLRDDPATVAIIVGAEVAHEVDFFFLEPRDLHDELLTLLFGGATWEHDWWWGVYASDYWGQPGEKWMSAWGMAYSDIVSEDPRFTSPRFTKAQAAAIRQILGLPRTDGKG